MNDRFGEGPDWAFVLARGIEGWRTKLVLGGAGLAAGGGTAATLEEAMDLIRSALVLLEQDETTVDLLGRLTGAAMDRRRSSTRQRSVSGLPDRDLLQTVWEASADAMALSNAEGIVLHANPAYCRLYGYSPEEVIGHPFSIIFPPDARDWAMASYHRTFQNPAIAPDVESAVRRADGSERIVEVRYDFVVHAGRRVAMLSAIRDVTERREAERLAQSRARILDVLVQPVVVVDPDGTVSYANRAAETLLGRIENVDQLAVALQPSIEDEHNREQMRSALSEVLVGESESIELSMAGPEGPVTVLAVSRLVAAGGGSGELTTVESPERVS